MGGSEKDFCIKCDQGGKVLSCSDSNCPIAVHEKCLGFPVKFDDAGNFYCPYCSYRRAIEESRQAWEKAHLRKKALSSFIDMKVINGDKHMHEVGRSEQKELGKLHTGNGNYNRGTDNENKLLDQATIHRNTLQPEEEQEENEFAPENAWIVSPHKDIYAIVAGKENAFSNMSGNDARPCDCNDRLVVVGHRTPSGPIVACGQDVYLEEEGSEQHFEMVEIGRPNQMEHYKQLNDDDAVETVETHIEDSHFSESHADPVEEGKSNVREEDLKEQAQESISSFVSDPGTLVALEEKEGFESTDILVSESDPAPSSKHVKTDKRSGHPSDVNHLKRSCQISSSALRANVEQVEELTAPTKLKKVTERSPGFSRYIFPSVRRKKLLWTDDEEEMLREGVQKYSSTDNKNIPWRKILEFGRHVFHDTRTPADLKDKWRNVLAKERC